MKFNSVIFHTSRLGELRDFYENKLGLKTGTYRKDGKELPDYSDSYVNYHLDGGLLCFETDAGRTDMGTVVLSVEDWTQFKQRLEVSGVPILAGNQHWLKIKDPEGRSLIIEPTSNR